jgi:hypothetical protein
MAGNSRIELEVTLIWTLEKAVITSKELTRNKRREKFYVCYRYTTLRLSQGLESNQNSVLAWEVTLIWTVAKLKNQNRQE